TSLHYSEQPLHRRAQAHFSRSTAAAFDPQSFTVTAPPHAEQTPALSHREPSRSKPQQLQQAASSAVDSSSFDVRHRAEALRDRRSTFAAILASPSKSDRA
ncbi:Unknown protein, partial [Striga hermonthica]